jgi:queuine tRNA-ribosyltransferase
MEIQRTIGADIIMAFDECTPYPCDYRYAQRSMKMTHLVRPMCESFKFSKTGYDQPFPIVQGSCYKDLRQQSEYIIVTKCKRHWRTFSWGTSRRNVCYDRGGL